LWDTQFMIELKHKPLYTKWAGRTAIHFGGRSFFNGPVNAASDANVTGVVKVKV
jgi:hypothetical protein